MVDYVISLDDGLTFNPASGTANVTGQVTHAQDFGGTSFFDTQMLQLDLIGPGGLMVRESPTLPSTGKTTQRPVAGGFMISSFFDVFTELSLDGGRNWQPAQSSPHRVRLRKNPRPAPPGPGPTRHLPPPPVGGSNPHIFNSQVDLEVSKDGGQTFPSVRVARRCPCG